MLGEQAGQDPDEALGGGGDECGEVGGRGGEAGVAGEVRGDDRLTFLGLQRADRIDEAPAGFQPLPGAGDQPRLQLGRFADDGGTGSIEDLGMAAEGAGRRARRVEQDRVEAALGRPVEHVGGHQLRAKAGAFEVLRQSLEPGLRGIHRRHFVARSG